MWIAVVVAFGILVMLRSAYREALVCTVQVERVCGGEVKRVRERMVFFPPGGECRYACAR